MCIRDSSEYEVAGSYLVSEGFTYLANAEGNLFSCEKLFLYI